jgi:hypothetical protein
LFYLNRRAAGGAGQAVVDGQAQPALREAAGQDGVYPVGVQAAHGGEEAPAHARRVAGRAEILRQHPRGVPDHVRQRGGVLLVEEEAQALAAGEGFLARRP